MAGRQACMRAVDVMALLIANYLLDALLLGGEALEDDHLPLVGLRLHLVWINRGWDGLWE